MLALSCFSLGLVLQPLASRPLVASRAAAADRARPLVLDGVSEYLLPAGLLLVTGALFTTQRDDSLVTSANLGGPAGDKDVSCYIVDGVEVDGKQQVICTGQKQEVEWFMGAELKPTDATPDKLQCEIDEAFNGEPEYVCTE